MSFHIDRTALTKLLFVAVFVAIAGFGIALDKEQEVSASAFGPSASHTDAPGEDNCTSCHASFPVNSGGGGVTISGLPHDYLPNQQIQVTVTTTHANATAYGFQMTAIDSVGRTVGTFTLPVQNPAKMQTINGLINNQVRQYVEHTVDGLFTPGVFGSNSWTFTWTAPSPRVGKVSFYAAGNGSDGTGGTTNDQIYTSATATLSGSAISNFDPDFQSDLAVFRPSNGAWYSYRLTDGNVKVVGWGVAGDKIAPGDYDGDGTTDYSVFRPSTGVWYVNRSSLGAMIVQFGTNGDLPAQGDYDGDGKTDIAIFRPSTGVWYLFQSTAGIAVVQWGLNGDKPAQGDYDGDAKTDIAVYRPSTGIWYLRQSTDGVAFYSFGISTDRLAQADYDGDGKTDIAVFRPSTGVWYRLYSTGGFNALQFGGNGDYPAAADFDADGKADLAIFRPTTGVWYYVRSTDNSFGVIQFGANNDIPVPSGYLGDSQ